MVRFTFKYLKAVALFLSIVILFQCCIIYNKKPVTVDQAIDENRVKIITTDGRKYVFDSIYYKSDSLLYGIRRKKTSYTEEIKILKGDIKEHILSIGKYETTETIITVDGREYSFDNTYYKNDTIYGIHKGKIQEEILIPIETIKKIRIYNLELLKRRFT